MRSGDSPSSPSVANSSTRVPSTSAGSSSIAPGASTIRRPAWCSPPAGSRRCCSSSATVVDGRPRITTAEGDRRLDRCRFVRVDRPTGGDPVGCRRPRHVREPDERRGRDGLDAVAERRIDVPRRSLDDLVRVVVIAAGLGRPSVPHQPHPRRRRRGRTRRDGHRRLLHPDGAQADRTMRDGHPPATRDRPRSRRPQDDHPRARQPARRRRDGVVVGSYQRRRPGRSAI